MERNRLSGSGGFGADRRILGLAVLFAFLFLVGLYESWMISVPVLLSVPVGVLGAFLGDRPDPVCGLPTSMPRSGSWC